MTCGVVLQHQDHQEQRVGGVTPVANSAQAKPASKTPWKTPPPLFADPATPATAAPASGWQDMYDDDQDGGHSSLTSAMLGVLRADNATALKLASAQDQHVVWHGHTSSRHAT